MDTKSYNRNLQHPKDRTITRVRISPKLREKAIARARLQSEKENSGLGDEADLKGCLGEVVTEYWMDNNNISYTEKLHSREYDYVLNNSGCTVDVKTKDRNFKPQRGYDCTVPFYNHRYQKPDFFLFVSLLTFDNSNDLRGLEKFEFAFIVGSATYGDLEKVGIAYLRDEQDWSNGTVMWTSALNILMYQLISVTDT
ncbi:hypothetical protein, partial [Shewanella sp. c952]|uniref:hypothetical protein n=1 Tax=Shewanella sp. c952 TaxID=2815913 RepID=UPI001C7D29A6